MPTKILLCCLLLVLTACAPEDKSKKVQEIDLKISELQKKIKKWEMDAMKSQLDSQGDLRDNYSEFASGITKAEHEEDMAKDLKKQVQLLEQKKAEILKEK